jgi:phytoene/squalene synthetase
MNSQRDKFLVIFNSIDFQKITDHPNILIAANFWEIERYRAAKIFYNFMRTIDDLIDNHKAKNKIIAPGERKEFQTNVENWMKIITTSTGSNPLQKELLTTLKKFKLPLWPLEAFAKSMIYDIHNDGFQTIESFINYAQGASVAPASVFVHLNGITKNNGKYEIPAFDVKNTATPCAIFSYIVHIIRDFQKDQLNNLNYFAENILLKNNLNRQKLHEFAEGRQLDKHFRNLMKEYYLLADKYRLETYDVIQKIRPSLEPRYQLSLEIIFDLYLMVFERIDLKNGTFTTKELNPTTEETKERVLKKIMHFKSDQAKSSAF